jgi:cytoskeletal protein RodZ
MIDGLPDLGCLRRNKGLTLQQIAQQTKISLRYLEAIEAGNTSCLPGGVYNNSYLRQYARAIDYDEDGLLEFFSTARLITRTAVHQKAKLDWRVALRAWAMRLR